MRRGRETRQRAGSAKDGGRDAAAAAGGNDDQGGELAAAASPSRQGFAFLHPEEDGGHRARLGARTWRPFGLSCLGLSRFVSNYFFLTKYYSFY